MIALASVIASPSFGLCTARRARALGYSSRKRQQKSAAPPALPRAGSDCTFSGQLSGSRTMDSLLHERDHDIYINLVYCSVYLVVDFVNLQFVMSWNLCRAARAMVQHPKAAMNGACSHFPVKMWNEGRA
jgi:hypothetical protein